MERVILEIVSNNDEYTELGGELRLRTADGTSYMYTYGYNYSSKMFQTFFTKSQLDKPIKVKAEILTDSYGRKILYRPRVLVEKEKWKL